MSLTLGSGYIFSECLLVSGNPPSAQVGLGNYLLGMIFRFDVKKSASPRILLDLEGSIFLKGKYLCSLSSSDGPVNIHSSENNDYATTKTFRAILTRETLNSIEAERHGSDLTLEIHFNGVVLLDGFRSEKVNTTLNYHIEQTQWLKLLDAWKFGDRVFLEIPIASETKKYKTAFDYFRQAQSLFNSGNWEQSVSECRKVLDCLHEIIDKSATLSDLLKSKKQNPLSTRVLCFILATKQICDPAGHGDANAASMEWTKGDAEMVLFQTATSLRRVLNL